MSYTITLTKDAVEDIEYLRQSGDKAALKKLANLIKELADHPRTGMGQPEEVKYEFTGFWSRRINSKHRLVSDRRRVRNCCNTIFKRPL
jgi:toxin YoeB